MPRRTPLAGAADPVPSLDDDPLEAGDELLFVANVEDEIRTAPGY